MGKWQSGSRTGYPKVEISSLLQRANDIALACRRDKKELEDAGLNWAIVDSLVKLSNECLWLNAKLVVEKSKCTSGTRRLDQFEKECRDFRSSIIRKMRAALELHPAPVPVLSYSEDRSRAKLIQDLCDLYVIIRENGPALARGGFDISLGERACERMQALSDLSVATVVSRNIPDELIKERNCLCHELMDLIMAICSLARGIFRVDDPRAADYRCGKSFF